jgi:antirestriction protein ArdC
MTSTKPRRDIYQEITSRIVAQFEEGTPPWRKPWTAVGGGVPLRHNGIPYRGVNILALWAAAMEKGYRSPIWMTFHQAILLGGCVRKGEKGTLTVFANALKRTATDEATGTETESQIHYLKGYTVFNAEQIDGLPQHYYAASLQSSHTPERIERAEAFFAATGAKVCSGGSTACYVMRTDLIHMPCIDTFRDAESYYATLAHECIHWTRHPARLDRSFGQERFGDDGYATEELVAELGSAFLCASLGLTPEPRADHASYIAGWLKALKDDTRAIFRAASHAQRAADFLHALQPEASRLVA